MGDFKEEFEKTLQSLVKVKDSEDVDQILLILDQLVKESVNLSADQLANYSIDYELKEILKKNKKSEIVEKVVDLLFLLKDVRILYDEIVSCLYVEECSMATLMLIFVLHKETNFYFEEYDEFFLSFLTEITLTSEGFLFFLLQNIERAIVLKKSKMVGKVINKLILTLKNIKSTKCLIKVLYVILVALRMHPSSYSMIYKEKLFIFTHSLQTVKQIVQRIFLEAKNPEMRPKAVFLENFAFPELSSRQQEIK